MLNEKMILDYGRLRKVIEAHKTLGHRIVCTIGSWDLLHIGHVRYLREAKRQGDILVVGADSDRAIKLYKNEFRPIVPEDERLEMLSYQDCVDYVTLIDDLDEKGAWDYELIRQIKPAVFVCIDESYPEQQKREIEQFCGQLVELPRQAKNTSTSALIERTIKAHLPQIKEFIGERNGEK